MEKAEQKCSAMDLAETDFLAFSSGHLHPFFPNRAWIWVSKTYILNAGHQVLLVF